MASAAGVAAASAAATSADCADGDARPRRLSDLPPRAPERRVAEDRTLALLFVCPETLDPASDGGELLCQQVQTCDRVRLFGIDEAHAVLSISQGWRELVARSGGVVARMRHVIAARGCPRPQLLAQTGTLPPAFEEEAVVRLRLDESFVFVRGGVDRESISFARMVMTDASSGESAGKYAVRVVQRLLAEAPAFALAGHKIIFVTKATAAPVIAAMLTKHVGQGVCAVPYATNGMTDEDRLQSLQDWQ